MYKKIYKKILPLYIKGKVVQVVKLCKPLVLNGLRCTT